MRSLILSLLFLAVTVYAGAGPVPVVPPVTDCTQYSISSARNIPDLQNQYGETFFEANILHFNRYTQLMTGNPVGPYFDVVSGLWNVNGSLNANLNFYSDAALTNPVGTGTIFCPNFQLVGESTVYRYAGGDCLLNTNVNYGSLVTATYDSPNFHPLTNVDIHFIIGDAEMGMDPLDLGIDGIAYYRNNAGNLTLALSLWGSDGWTAQYGYDTKAPGQAYNLRQTGMDLRAALTCMNVQPYVPPCACAGATLNPCNIINGQTYSYTATQSGTNGANGLPCASIGWAAYLGPTQCTVPPCTVGC